MTARSHEHLDTSVDEGSSKSPPSHDDKLERLLQTYRGRPTAPLPWKLDVVMDLESLDDPRILPFLLEVLLDDDEASEVRLRVVGHLRDARRVGDARVCVASALSEVLGDRSSSDVRLAAVLALRVFTDSADVCAILGALANDKAEELDLRYSAFTSLIHAGPRVDVAVVVRNLSTDAVLGPAARDLLSRWQLA